MDIGLKNKMEFVVREEHLANTVRSGELEVLSTPMLLAFLEECCWRSIASELDPSQTTVGTSCSFQHTKASALGARITVQTELVEVDRRRLVFAVRAYDEVGEIAHGTLERIVVAKERFMAKVQGERDTLD